MELEEAKKMVTEAGLIIRSSDDDEKFVSTKVSEAIKERDRNHWTELREAVKGASGIDAEENEKSVDFAVRALTQKSEAFKDLDERYNKILKDKSGSDEATAELNAQLDKIKADLKAANDTLQTKEQEWAKNQFQTRIDSMVSEAISSLRPSFKGFEDKQILENNLKAVISDFKGEIEFKEVEGTLVLKSKTSGEPLTSSQDGHNLTIKEVLSQRLDFLIDKSAKGQGAGMNPNGMSGGQGASGGINYQLPDTVKTKVALTEWLQNDKGLSPASSDFMKAYTELGKDLPLR